MHKLDFNLLVTLDALLVEGSVRGAAERMNVTAPAMSHALARLRRELGDPLLVRAGQGLVPTPRALALRERVRNLVDEGRAIFRVQSKETLEDVHRTFTIRANGNAISVFAAALVKKLRPESPGIQIRFVPEGDEGVSSLRDGTVDLVIGVTSDIGPELRVERLFEDPFVGVVRLGHSLATGRMTLKRFAAAAHVVGSRRGRARGPVDSILEGAGLSRRVPVIVPDMLGAIAVAAGSDHVATVPASVANWARATMRIQVIALPFATEPVTIFMSWHPRFEFDPTHAWLRKCIHACGQELIL